MGATESDFYLPFASTSVLSFLLFVFFFKTLMALLSSIKFHYHVLFKLCVCDLITMLGINSEVFFSSTFFLQNLKLLKRASFF